MHRTCSEGPVAALQVEMCAPQHSSQSAQALNRPAIGALVASVSHTQKAPLFLEDSSNVEVALMCFGHAKAQPIKSGYKLLIIFNKLVAGVGFEPTTFRL